MMAMAVAHSGETSEHEMKTWKCMLGTNELRTRKPSPSGKKSRLCEAKAMTATGGSESHGKRQDRS